MLMGLIDYIDGIATYSDGAYILYSHFIQCSFNEYILNVFTLYSFCLFSGLSIYSEGIQSPAYIFGPKRS